MTGPIAAAWFGAPHPLLSATFSLGHGISPSIATLRVPPLSAPLPLSGALVLQYGDRRIKFRDCRLDRVEPSSDESGRETWDLIVLDRRWAWRESGAVSGFYNTRRAERILPATAKKPSELIQICLDALGERGATVRVDDSTRPEIEWDYTPPAEALSRVCEAIGCRVILGVDDRVYVLPAGEGRPLPSGPIISGGLVMDPAEAPGKLVVVTARPRFQADLPLEAVGVELMGEVKPIDQLSYAPTIDGRKTWEYADAEHFQDLTDPAIRGLAQRSVFRWYRIKPPFQLPSYREKIDDAARVLPLLDAQVEYWQNGERYEPRPPWVFGSFWGGHEATESDVDQPRERLRNEPAGLYTRGFSIDAERGIVQFSDPVVKLEPDQDVDAGSRVKPADLRLRIAVNLRDPETRAWIRFEYPEKQSAGRGGRSGRRSPRIREATRYLLRDDMIPWAFTDTDRNGRLETNGGDLQAEARYHLQRERASLTGTDGGSVTYAGWLFQPLDGAIRQVAWQLDDRGRPTTRISRNTEELILGPSYRERRMVEQLGAALAKRDKPERQRAEDSNRNRG